MNIQKEYENEIEMTITKRNTIILIHKNCLKGGE